MIPKNLFFIWFGDNPPKYCEFAINAFKDVNPDFKVEFIRKSSKEVDDWENSKDELLKISCKRVLNRKNGNFNTGRANFACAVSDQYRTFLLKKYGGVYLDCDTFPIKPFSSGTILKCYTSYWATEYFPNSELLFHTDIFHIGSVKLSDINRNVPIRYLYPPHRLYNFVNNKEWNILYNKFINCTLKYGEYMHDYEGKYIEHFKTLSWKPENRIEKSERYENK